MINAHTHIFTIRHVPDRFGKRLVPVIGRMISLQFVTRLVSPFLRKNGQLQTNKVIWVVKVASRVFAFLIGRMLRFVGIKELFKNLIGALNKDFLSRVLRLIDYATLEYPNNNQEVLFNMLQSYYPVNTRFVVLTMDMEMMSAGAPAEDFDDQLKEIKALKVKYGELIVPFLCIDPRRLTASGKLQKSYQYYFDLLESGVYEGIKLYPALGYYPFDWRLLPFYQCAIERNLPIMTHCSRGPVFDRRSWHSEMQIHPFTKTSFLNRKPRFGGVKTDYTAQYTHPLNYLVMTNSAYLKHYLEGVEITEMDERTFAAWQEVQSYLGIQSGAVDIPDLSQLKFCLAHWGGGDEWDRYLADYTFKPYDANSPLDGLHNAQKFEYVWQNYSWFNLINQMLLDDRFQFYTDISFTLHEEKYLNTLKVHLSDPALSNIRNRVIFGTDYYVVSHKETEREFGIDVRGQLGEDLWKQIAEKNPQNYL